MSNFLVVFLDSVELMIIIGDATLGRAAGVEGLAAGKSFNAGTDSSDSSVCDVCSVMLPISNCNLSF